VTDVPEPVARTAGLMAAFERPWALCGGWAVDAWVGRQTRDHLDVDLTVFEDDQRAVVDFFGARWLLKGHDAHDDDSTEPWDGHRLELPAHIHARASGFELDIQLNRRDGSEWLFATPPGLRLPLERAIRTPGWGVPTLAPEVLLLYKAVGDVRAHDQADLRTLLPVLTPEERAWLRESIGAIDSRHSWRRLLA
jgi:Aminoglycoside-2''-adenylyltransferase